MVAEAKAVTRPDGSRSPRGLLLSSPAAASLRHDQPGLGGSLGGGGALLPLRKGTVTQTQLDTRGRLDAELGICSTIPWEYGKVRCIFSPCALDLAYLGTVIPLS